MSSRYFLERRQPDLSPKDPLLHQKETRSAYGMMHLINIIIKTFVGKKPKKHVCHRQKIRFEVKSELRVGDTQTKGLLHVNTLFQKPSKSFP